MPSIIVTQLGIFDSGANGLTTTLTANLWHNDTNNANHDRYEARRVDIRCGQPGHSRGRRPLQAPGHAALLGARQVHDFRLRIWHCEILPDVLLSGGPSLESKTFNTGAWGDYFQSDVALAIRVHFPQTQTGNSPAGFSAATFKFESAVFAPQIATNVAAAMAGTNATGYLRIPFHRDRSKSPAQIVFKRQVRRRLRGVYQWPRGRSPQRTASAAWNSAATAEHADLAALALESIDVSAFDSLLQVGGNNVLSIQVLNASAANADMLFNASWSTRRSSATANHFTPCPRPAPPTPRSITTKSKTSPSITTVVITIRLRRGHHHRHARRDDSLHDRWLGPDGNDAAQSIHGPMHIGTTTTLRAMAYKTGLRFAPRSKRKRTFSSTM